MMERNKKCMRELSAQASKVSFDRKDIEKYLAEWRSFDTLDVVDDGSDSAPGPECVDIDKALADPKYVAWARGRGLDARSWLLKSLRISLTHTKRRAPAQNAEMKAQMDTQRRELAKHCKSMGPNACSDMEKAFGQSEEAMRDMAATMALLPEPSRAEAALLTEYDARLTAVHEDPPRRRDGGMEPGDAGPPPDGGDEGDDGK
jgi:hypothetical protein